MKKFLILLLLVSFGFSDCVLISSPYPKVESIKEPSFYGQKYTIGEVKSFSDAYVKFLNANGFEIIDCQVYSDHLSSLGAQNVDRKYFLAILKEHVLPSVLDGKNWKALFTKLITH